MDHNDRNENIKNEFGWFADKPKVPKKLFNFKAVVIGLAIFLILVTRADLEELSAKSVAGSRSQADTPGHHGAGRKRSPLRGKQRVDPGQPYAAAGGLAGGSGPQRQA